MKEKREALDLFLNILKIVASLVILTGYEATMQIKDLLKE